MATTFPIHTSDGITIANASDGYLWTRSASVGFTRLAPIQLAAVVLMVPSTSFEALPALIKRAKKAKGETIGKVLIAIAAPGSRDHIGFRGPSELEQHVKNGCRIPRCKVCG